MNNVLTICLNLAFLYKEQKIVLLGKNRHSKNVVKPIRKDQGAIQFQVSRTTVHEQTALCSSGFFK